MPVAEVAERGSPAWTTPRVALAWLASKALMIALWIALAPVFQTDLAYYAHQLEPLGTAGAGHVLVEYPTPVVWVLALLRSVAVTARAFPYVFVATMLLVDASVAWALWAHRDANGERRPIAVLTWIGVTFALGPTTAMRFDVLTAGLATAAILLLASRRSGWAGTALGVGAALKLWPALLWLTTLGRRDRGRVASGFWSAGGLLAVASLMWAGWDRLVSPLTWQGDRGLQVESVWATAPMLRRLCSPAWTVAKSEYNAYEISGPGVAAWTTASTAATVLALAGASWLVVRWARRVGDDVVGTALAMLLLIGVLVVTNKTFSPQYALWLAAPACALLAVSPRRAWPRLPWALVSLCTATQVVYPVLYGPLVTSPSPLTALATVVLVLRNLGLVTLTAWLAVVLHRRGGTCA